MSCYILLTRLISEEVHPTFSVREKAKAVKKKVRETCPEVVWLSNYVTLGPWDYVDVFEAPDTETAMKVASLVRSHGGAHTEIWPALEWDSFKDTVMKEVA